MFEFDLPWPGAQTIGRRCPHCNKPASRPPTGGGPVADRGLTRAALPRTLDLLRVPQRKPGARNAGCSTRANLTPHEAGLLDGAQRRWKRSGARRRARIPTGWPATVRQGRLLRLVGSRKVQAAGEMICASVLSSFGLSTCEYRRTTSITGTPSAPASSIARVANRTAARVVAAARCQRPGGRRPGRVRRRARSR